MKVFIFTEGGTKSGLGHVTRCCALYEGFIKEKITPFIFVNSDRRFDVLKNVRHRIVDWLGQEEKFLDIIKGADIVVVDSYQAGLAFYKKVSVLVKTPVYIDDCHRLDYPKGVILNPNIGAEKAYGFTYKKNQQVFLGGKYLLLRKEFVKEEKAKRHFPAMPRRVLITMGASQAANDFTAVVVNAFRKANIRSLEMKIVVPAKNRTALVDAIRGCRFPVDVLSESSTMVGLMKQADIAFNPLGVTSAEMFWMQLPFIFRKTNTVQNVYAAEYKKAGILSCDSPASLSATIKKIFREDFYRQYCSRFRRIRAGLNCFDVRLLLP